MRKISITFDDGPCSQTLEILQLLKDHNAKGSFFVTGKLAAGNPDIILQITQQGHILGNHSYNHKPWFPVLPVDSIKEEISKTQKVLKDITGSEPKYFRPPYGVTNPLLAKALSGFALTTAGWSVRSLDTVKKNSKKISARIIRKIKPGSIILLHDTSAQCIPVLKQLLVYCARNKIQPVTLDELINVK